MKFIVSSSYLLKNLQNVGRVILSNNTLPILDNFIMKLSDGKLTVTASDMESTISCELDVESEEDGMTALPADILLKTLKTFAEQPLTFHLKDGAMNVNYDKGSSDIAVADPEQFPNVSEIEDGDRITIMGDILSTAIDKTIFATGTEDLRPVMSGIFFEFGKEAITFVATDAHKLVKYKRTDIQAERESSFIMPSKPLNLLKGLLAGSEEDVTIEYDEKHAKYSFENITVISRLIDGKYPNYEAVIPNENPNHLTRERNQFLNTVRRVSIFSNRATNQLRLRMAGAELNISAEDIDYSNKAEERLTCDYQGEDLQIGFNSKFLLEMLNHLESEEVLLKMSLPNRAGILTPMDGLDEGEEITMLVMPVMLGNDA